MTEESRLIESEYGLVAETGGWFVVNVRDAAWMTNEHFGSACIFEGGPVGFHREGNQENFLVLAGECLLLIEGEERRLRSWDFVHCPPDTEHGFVALGDEPCVIFMTGSRVGWPDKGIVYARPEVAVRHGNVAARETSSPNEAYATFPPWRPGRPAFDGLPWG
jgi:mannose-6-phosphate isomerase-like protein (cupin superfamily)